MKVIVKFSGGKDSLASLGTLLAAKSIEPNFEVVFCDTGWEHPDMYPYLDYIEEKIGKKIIRLKNSKYPNGLPDQAKRKGRFASLKARFCTTELKVEPGIDYVLSQTEDVVIYQGVRADESRSRAAMKPRDEYFRFYFEPLRYKGKYDKQIKALSKRIVAAGERASMGNLFGDELSLLEQMRQLRALNEPTLRPVFHTYRAKEVRAWCQKYSADVVRPVFRWSAEQVISYCIELGFKLNPLYYKGAKRVGCYPCTFSSLAEIALIAENDPWRIDEIAAMEQETGNGATFFAQDKIPARFHTGKFERNGVIHKVPLITDVVNYVLNNRADALKLDAGRPSSGCISHYNICETEPGQALSLAGTNG